jgi:signal transduction histidine kinase
MAVLFNARDEVFASYIRASDANRPVPSLDGHVGHEFVREGLELVRPIEDDQRRRIGTLYLLSDLQEVYSRMFRYAQIALLVLVLAFCVAALLTARLQRLISDPLLHLADTARAIAERKDYGVRARRHAPDEIGYLTTAFNQMLDQIQAQEAEIQASHAEELAAQVEELRRQIEERKRAEHEREVLHRQLQEISRQAGMAEVATGVLHNVGNVLNSVNVSASVVADRIRHSRAVGVGRLARLLGEHQEDLALFLVHDPRGQAVPEYLQQLAQHLQQDQEAVQQELDLLTKNIEHIKEIVSVQQNYARVSGIRQVLPLTQLMEDALQMTQASFDRHGIRVVREFDTVPPVAVDKHKVLQILLNLLRNAKQALLTSSQAHRCIHLRIQKPGDDSVIVQVEDNGVGIAPENLTRIFSHGFTTKRDGHGFGLHLGALTAREMGGQLKAESDGVGQGARFALELPLTQRPAPLPMPKAELPPSDLTLQVAI